MHDRRVGGDGKGDVGSNEQPGDDVAENNGLLESMKDDRRQGRYAEDQRESLKKRGRRMHERS